MNELLINKHNKPYNHLIINNFLDKKFIDDIIENFPEINNFNDTKRNEQIINNKSTRRSFYLDKQEDFQKIKNKNIFIRLYKHFNNKEFLNNIFKVFNKEIPKDYHLQFQLIFDTKGYNILPHCDNFKNKRHKYLTLLIYLPDNDNLKEYGTEMYRENNNGIISFFDKEVNKKRSFSIVKKVPFKKNTLFAFIPEYDKTWHGVSKIEKNITRRSIQIFLKEKKSINYKIESSLF
jgi:hypothetical protein